MRVSRIFQEVPLEHNKILTLDEAATRHLMTVLRLKVKDKLILFNGDGFEYPAVVSDIQHHKMQVTITACVEKNVESSLLLHLGQVISRGDRMDYTLQKATELGITAITPLFSTRSEVRLKGEREEKKMAHWQKVLVSACEQCGRNRIPTLYSPQPVDFWVHAMQATPTQTNILLDHLAQRRLQEVPLAGPIALLIGPEGGLTFQEKQYAEEKGFMGIKMGNRILRTETAGVAAIALLQYLGGDL